MSSRISTKPFIGKIFFPPTLMPLKRAMYVFILDSFFTLHKGLTSGAQVRMINLHTTMTINESSSHYKHHLQPFVRLAIIHYHAPQNLKSRIINRADAKLDKTALIEFHRFQRGSKSSRANFRAVSLIASTSRVCSLLFSGILMMTVGN